MLMDPHVSKLSNGQEERNSGDKTEGQSSSALELLLFLFRSRDPRDNMNKPILQSTVMTASTVEIMEHLQSLMALLALCHPSDIVLRDLHQLYDCLFSLFHVALLHAINRTL